jgi:lipid-A-disaccharide synthase
VVYPSEEVFDQLQRYTRVAPFSLVPSGSPLAASAVLTSSGTMSMRCALAGVPGAIAYRANLFSYLLARRLVKVKFIGIANLLLGEAMYPEHIQFSATPARLAAQLQDCVTNLARAEKTHRYAERLRTLLSRPAEGSVGEWLATQLAADRPLDPDRSAGLQALP